MKYKYFAVRLDLLIGTDKYLEVSKMDYENRAKWLEENRKRLRTEIEKTQQVKNIIYDELKVTEMFLLYCGKFIL
jgi:hypothetical protein